MVKSNRLSVRRRSPVVYWAVSLAVACALLYYSLRGIDWQQVSMVVRRAQRVYVALTFATMSLNLFIRSLRWRILLSAEVSVPIMPTFWATSAGYLGNNVLPARAGEVIRTVIISRQSGMSQAFVLTTALFERVVDAIALLMIGSVVLLTLPTNPEWFAGAIRPVAVIGLCSVLAIALLPAFESFWLGILARIPIPAAFRDRVVDLARKVIQAVRSFQDPWRLGRFLLLTALIWCLDGIAVVICAHSIMISLAFPMALLLLAGLGLGSALPSTPGYVGIYQFVAVSILTPFGFSRNDAIAFILLFQAIGYTVVLLWGAIGLSKRHKATAVPAHSRTTPPSPASDSA